MWGHLQTRAVAPLGPAGYRARALWAWFLGSKLMLTCGTIPTAERSQVAAVGKELKTLGQTSALCYFLQTATVSDPHVKEDVRLNPWAVRLACLEAASAAVIPKKQTQVPFDGIQLVS